MTDVTPQAGVTDSAAGQRQGSPWALRVLAWACIALGVVAFIVAGDVRTNWIVGDIAPDLGEVAVPRLGSMALMLGLALLAWHQIRSRRALPFGRYRGPAAVVLVGLIVGLSILLVLPVRGSVNLLFSGGVPDWPPVVIWMVGTHVATLAVTWLAVFRPDALVGLRLFRDARPIRHAAIGVVVGAVTIVGVLLASFIIEAASPGQTFQVGADGYAGTAPPGVPPVITAVISVGLAPLAEETFFRGVVLNAWRREYGLRVGLAGSAALFGFVHFGLNPVEGIAAELPRLALLAAGGLVLGILAVRTESLIAPISAHATMNATILVLGGLLTM